MLVPVPVQVAHTREECNHRICHKQIDTRGVFSQHQARRPLCVSHRECLSNGMPTSATCDVDSFACFFFIILDAFLDEAQGK